jgi:mRNA interferase MazF
LKRGDLVTVALSGDYGKPRPALIIQSDLFSALPSMTVLPVTSDLSQASLLRIFLAPTAENGLQKPSQIMIDKIVTVPVKRLGKPFGRIDDNTLVAVNRALALLLAFA